MATSLIHICFDSNVRGILEQCGAALEGTRENSTILTLSDDLALGPLVPETPAWPWRVPVSPRKETRFSSATAPP